MFQSLINVKLKSSVLYHVSWISCRNETREWSTDFVNNENKESEVEALTGSPLPALFQSKSIFMCKVGLPPHCSCLCTVWFFRSSGGRSSFFWGGGTEFQQIQFQGLRSCCVPFMVPGLWFWSGLRFVDPGLNMKFWWSRFCSQLRPDDPLRPVGFSAGSGCGCGGGSQRRTSSRTVNSAALRRCCWVETTGMTRRWRRSLRCESGDEPWGETSDWTSDRTPHTRTKPSVSSSAQTQTGNNETWSTSLRNRAGTSPQVKVSKVKELKY